MSSILILELNCPQEQTKEKIRHFHECCLDIFKPEEISPEREKPEMVLFPLQGYAYVCVGVQKQSNTLTLAILVLT